MRRRFGIGVLSWHFDINGFYVEFVSGGDANVEAAAGRACKILITRGKTLLAHLALHFGWNPVKMKPGTICQGILADHLPIELDRIVNDRRQLANDQMKIANALRTRFFGVAKGYFQDIFSNSQFVHLNPKNSKFSLFLPIK